MEIPECFKFNKGGRTLGTSPPKLGSKTNLSCSQAILDSYKLDKDKILLAVTISPSTSYKYVGIRKWIFHETFKKFNKIPYGRLRPANQALVCDAIVSTMFDEEESVSDYWFTHEMNSSGNIHLHGIVCINEPFRHANYHLKDVRADFALTFGSKNCVKFAHIVLIEESDRLEKWKVYLVKDWGKHPNKILIK